MRHPPVLVANSRAAESGAGGIAPGPVLFLSRTLHNTGHSILCLEPNDSNECTLFYKKTQFLPEFKYSQLMSF